MLASFNNVQNKRITVMEQQFKQNITASLSPLSFKMKKEVTHPICIIAPESVKIAKLILRISEQCSKKGIFHTRYSH
jgi:hypothetical protein